MRDRSEVLKKRRSILLVGTILIAAVPFSGAFAAEQAAPAVTAAVPEWPKWYFYGGYAFDFWGRSVGLNNQSYTLDASELGRHYLSLGWDQTPHLISTSAKNI